MIYLYKRKDPFSTYTKEICFSPVVKWLALNLKVTDSTYTKEKTHFLTLYCKIIVEELIKLIELVKCGCTYIDKKKKKQSLQISELLPKYFKLKDKDFINLELSKFDSMCCQKSDNSSKVQYIIRADPACQEI